MSDIDHGYEEAFSRVLAAANPSDIEYARDEFDGHLYPGDRRVCYKAVTVAGKPIPKGYAVNFVKASWPDNGGEYFYVNNATLRTDFEVPCIDVETEDEARKVVLDELRRIDDRLCPDSSQIRFPGD